MEEYARSEEEATPELQNAETEQSVPDERTDTKPPTEEGRKRKMNGEEGNEQDKEDNMDDEVSNRAYEVMQNKMRKKDFIGVRGLK